MKPVTVKVPPEWWSLNALPEGCIEGWLAADGDQVEAGHPLARIRVEGALHELMAPAAGRLTIDAKTNSVVDPGMEVARIAPRLDA